LIGGVVTWTIGTLPAAAPQQCVQLTLKVNAAPGSTVVNIATIDTAETSASTATDDTPVAKIAVPTLSQWGMVLFMLLMGLVGLRSIAKVRER
jgi:ABC-type sugar transport system permease subunit